MKHYINLMRLNKPVGIWLLLLPCWIGLLMFSIDIPIREMALFAVGAVAMRSAGCIINDIADRKIDAQVERTKMRPLACGVISLPAAIITLILLLLVVLMVAIMLGTKVVMLGLAWLPLVAAYPFMKRITWWPQAFLGITFGAGGLFASIAVNGEITSPAIIFYLGCIFWVIGYDTIYACQDMEDDAKIGVKSTALLFGKHVKMSITICYTIAFSLFFQIFIKANVGMVGLCGLFASLFILVWQIQQLNLKQSPNYNNIFKSNALFGFIIVIGLLIEKYVITT
jgi:4-hydroxybenzoate polyprenyltransferase